MINRRGVFFNKSSQSYDEVWRLQKQWVQDRIAEERSDTFLLVEHEPVFTLGRTTKEAHWGGKTEALRNRGFRVHEVERGGSVTYHGPGQIVGYPILQLRNYCSGPRAYMHMLGEVIIRVLSDWGIDGKRVEKFLGVWVHDPKNQGGPLAKIAAMGVKISRGVTMHGFALNVTVDLEPFQYIVPCGIEGCRMTSMADVLGREPELDKVRERIGHHFGDVFGLEWTERITEISTHPPFA